MQVFVTCPDLGLPAVSVTVGADSVVSDVLTTAADEWDVDADEVELSFAGDALCENERLVDYGVGANSELEMREKLVRIFCKNWFVDDRKREKLLLWMKDRITKVLYLDTPTFSEDGCLTIDKGLLPSDAKRISFRHSNSNNTVISQVTSIGILFLSECSQITSLDLSSLSSVTSVGNFFVFCCSGITAIDLSGLSSVSSIGSYFLSFCSGITSLDFSGLSSVTRIGEYFLSHCSGITALDLSGLSSVTTIGEYFLSHCSQITSLDFSGLSSVTSIGEYFLSHCPGITSLDLSGLSSVNKTERWSLNGSTALESLQLSQSNAALLEEFMRSG